MSRKNTIHNKPILLEERRVLRNNPTPEEKLLWQHLKGNKTGFKIRRQHSIDNFIIDFYCADKRVAIEIDGAYHFTSEGKQADLRRDEFLKQLNVKVLRISNNRVSNHLGETLEAIKSFLESI